ncbi:rab proteins geranylgeranyltransferase component A 1 [Mixophyes fleayi]|uniref:rab proteins geranylgeranyltransferase component A 1 n=1 Tax=Mixophyes fleayi TaxID=3061075 RepID=UPI003F4E04CC
MADELPAEFDVVILGTGLTESIVAAACSRIGQRVLHLDARNYYAGNWASFTFSGLQTWIEDYKQRDLSTDDNTTSEENISENAEQILLNQRDKTIQNIEVFSYSRNEELGDVEEVGALGVNPELLTTESTVTDSTGEGAPPETPATDQPDVPSEVQDKHEPENAASSDHEESAGSDQIPSDVTVPASETEPSDVTVPASETEPSDVTVPASETEPSDVTVPACETEPSSPSACQRDPQKTIKYSDIVREGRRFNIDLVSKLLYSRGSLIDLLIKSNVSRYTEFKNVTRILTYHNGRIEQVPCSRADVFASKQLSMIEKRTLMKFLTFCADYEEHIEEYQEYKDCTFSEFLQSKRLTPSLQHFVLCSIAMVSKNTNTVDGLKATQQFLWCLGRYGNTPFLFHMYGLGEIPQCFCRMSAVFGGVYCLHHSLRCLLVDEDSQRCNAVIDSRGKRISCNYVILEESYLPETTCTQVCYRQISRAVLITDRSILKSESDQEISVLTVPPEDGQQDAVYMTELSSATNTCMKNTYLVHLTCSSVKTTARDDLEPVIRNLFTLEAAEDPQSVQPEKPQVLWMMYFNMRDSSGIERQSYVGLPSNVYVCSGPDPGFGYDHAVEQAENIFREMYPTEEFCPPAPNPEDIIYDRETTEQDPGEPNTTEDCKPDSSPETEAVTETTEDTEDPKTE